MVGFITEQNLEQAEEAFPGIRNLFEALPRKPRTFLELLAVFQHWCGAASASPASAGDTAPASGGDFPRQALRVPVTSAAQRSMAW